MKRTVCRPNVMIFVGPEWNNTLYVRNNISGVARIECRVNERNWMVCGGLPPGKGAVKIPGGGIYLVEYRAVDNAGNVEFAKNLTVKIDAGNPEFRLVNRDELVYKTVHKNTIVIRWYSDATDIEYYEVSTDCDNWINVGLATSHKFTLSKGENNLYIRAVDKAGLTWTETAVIRYETGFIPGFEMVYVIILIGISGILFRRR